MAFQKQILRWVLFSVSLLTFQLAMAQKWDYGVGVGTLLYRGELSDTYNPLNVRAAVAPFMRINLQNAVSLRVQATLGALRADNNTTNNLYFNQINPSSFEQFIGELGMMAEYNFLDFRRGRLPDKYTPYIFGGIAGLYNTSNNIEKEKLSSFNISIPFGIGYKLALGRHYTLATEAGFRKTFMGLLDGRHDQYKSKVTNVNNTNYYSLEPQRGYTAFNDWYAFFGFTISYTFITIKCPEDDDYDAH
jgi:hypothetical protein